MNQNLQEYLSSDEYRRFLDVDLQQMACTAVDRIIGTMKGESPKLARRSQIQSISSIVQAQDMTGLEELAKHQKDKNSKKENKMFWTLVYQHLVDLNDQNALRVFARRFLAERQIVRDEKQLQDKAAQGRQKSLNNEAIRDFLNAIAPVYFEHFTCHYYYCTSGGK